MPATKIGAVCRRLAVLSVKLSAGLVGALYAYSLTPYSVQEESTFYFISSIPETSGRSAARFEGPRRISYRRFEWVTKPGVEPKQTAVVTYDVARFGLWSTLAVWTEE